MPNPLKITTVSWIDRRNLPTPRIGKLIELARGGEVGWDDRTMVGLIATSNPTPPATLGNLEGFRANRQFRAITALELKPDLSGVIGDPILDPGWTPPFDKAKLPWWARAKSPPAEALKAHPGESSALSQVTIGRQSPISALPRAPGDSVVANVIIKFRAGAATNQLGLEEADSRYHVPWVWCETLLQKTRTGLQLVGCGSQFPSHAWYVDGKQIALSLQKALHARPDEPAISTGRPSRLPRLRADADRSQGTITGHRYTVAAGQVHRVTLRR